MNTHKKMKRAILVLSIFLTVGYINVYASKEMALNERIKGENKLILQSKYQYTLEDLDLLAHVINAEGGASSVVSDEMCYYIGSVVLNRVEDKDFPNTIREVVFQKGQYQSTWDNNWSVPINDRSYDIAQELLDTGSKLPKNVVYQSEFIQGNGCYIKVQNMYFCYK